MIKVGELDLLPVPGWQAPPTYFISAGGLGYEALSWQMHYIKEYLPEGIGMEDFTAARFMAIDTAPPDKDDLPAEDWAEKNLIRLFGNLGQIIDEEVDKGLFPGIPEFYEDTDVARLIRHEVGDLKDGAGTTRPFGRIGFFYNWEALYESLRALLNSDISSQEMRFGKTFEIINQSSRHFFIIS